MNWKHDIYFIAELGQNHQGSLEIAKKMVDSLVGTPVSAIKTAKRDNDSMPEELKVMPYLNPHSFGDTYLEHRRALELSDSDFEELKFYVESKGFDFISSFTDAGSFYFLMSLDVKLLKIASQRVVDIDLLNMIVAGMDEDVEVIMSSGMSDIKEVDNMVNIFKEYRKYLLQCTSVYPCPEELINLRVLRTYRNRYKGKVDGFGLSGHHSGIAPDIAACRMGASIIERHYTLDKGMKGSDHGASLELDQVRQFFKMMDSINVSLGSGTKRVLEEEAPAIKKLRGDLCKR